MEITQNIEVSVKRSGTSVDGHAGRMANLKPFRKGISGNPGGRPKEQSTEVRTLAQKRTKAAFEKIVEMIESKDERVALAACKEVLDRALGKPGKIDANSDASTVQVNIVRHREKIPPCN